MNCYIIDLGVMNYKESLELQEKLVDARQKDILKQDILLLVEHPPVLTFGVNTQENELKISRDKLKELGIEIFQINRGGNVTYHGPGQLVGYPIIKMSLNDSISFSNKLEELMLKTGKLYCEKLYIRTDVKPENKKRYVGVWFNDENSTFKIGSVGVQFKQFKGNLFSMHGFAINVCTKHLEHFDLIDPCGLKDIKINSLKKIHGKEILMNLFKEEIAKNFKEIFQYENMDKISMEEIKRIIG